MSQNIFQELQFLLYAILFGAFLTSVYDIFRILRRVFQHSNILISLEDLIFWIYCAVSVFYLLNYQSDGKLRWFSAAGAALGMGFYHLTFSRIFVPFFSFLFGKLAKGIGCILHILWIPAKSAGKQSKRLGQRGARFAKKKLTVSRKMLKIMLHKQ